MALDYNKLTNLDYTKLQTMLFPKLTKYIPHTPTPKQAAFLLLNNKEAFYGGAVGGGKSDALLMGGLQYVDAPGYSGIIFRKSFADLNKPGALITRSKEWLAPFRASGEAKWNDREKRWEFIDKYGPHKETRSMLQFGYLENSNDKYNYQGGEYQFIGFDELTHIDRDSYTYMFSRMRRLKTGVQVPLRVRGASNPPDDDQGIWVKTRFIDEGPKFKRIFVPAGLDDNPYLDAEEYEKALDELDPVTRRRLRFGDWEITRKGNMFKRTWFDPVEKLPNIKKIVRNWDMASTDPEAVKKKNKSNEPDYTASCKMGIGYDGYYYIMDITRDRKSPEQTESLQKQIAKLDGKSVLIREEKEPGSSGESLIYLKSKSIFKGYDYEANRSTGSKTTKASPLSAAADKGKIRYLRSCRNITEFFDEAESFPGGLHDDMVDAVAGAYNELASRPTTTGAPISMLVDEDLDWKQDFEFTPGAFSNFERRRW